MSDAITPALPPEEWESGVALDDMIRYQAANVTGPRAIVWLEDGSYFTVKRPHALAALALHRQPFGPTPAMLATLDAERAWNIYDGGDAECPQCGGEHWKICNPPICVPCGYHMPLRPAVEDLDAVRAFVAALLPPETP